MKKIRNKNDYNGLYETGKIIANKWFRENRVIFLANDYDQNDLMQETNIVIMAIIKKYSGKKNKDIVRLSNNAINKKMMNILRNFKNRFFIIANLKRKEQKENFDNMNDILEEEIADNSFRVFNKEMTKEEVNSFNRIKGLGFKLEDLNSFLTEEEYDIVYEIFKNGSTLDRLARKYECTKQCISKIYLKSIVKIKKYLGIYNLTKKVS